MKQLLLVSVLAFLDGCSKQDLVPAQLTTLEVINITQTTAQSGGSIIFDGGSAVTEYGVCWSINPDPTVLDERTSDGRIPGPFISLVTGLMKNTTYYLRAYITNAQGTWYGNTVSFTTSKNNAQGCDPLDVPECNGAGVLETDPAIANSLLIGTWDWQSTYSTWPDNNVWTIKPYPNGCNMKLAFKTDQTYVLTIGDNPKASGTYVVDQQDIVLNDQTWTGIPPQNIVHQFRMHLTLNPDPKVTEQYGPGVSYYPYFYISGLLQVSSDGNCLELSTWRRDMHGYVYTSGNKFVKIK